MQRRNFIRVMMAGTTGALFLPGFLSGCNASSPESALEAWSGPDSTEKDIRILVLSYAILAANPHNIQPWLIDLKSPTSMDLYVDQTRLLPETDPPARQIHIGQGTFLENLSIAAKTYDYEAKIEYFPKGMYSNQETLDRPVASIQLEKKSAVNPDPLFASILKRQSNKRNYEAEELSNELLEQLQSQYQSDVSTFHWSNDPQLRKQLAVLLGKSMEIETQAHKRNLESLAMFRFNQEEVEKYRDGFSLANSGVTGMKRWVAEKFFIGNREDIAQGKDKSFEEASVDFTQKQADSAAAFGWIVSPQNTRLDQVKIGRVYQRVNLLTTQMGVAQHPMSQILEEYSEMNSLQKEFHQLLKIPEGHTVQMIFRLGKADPVTHSPRREIKKLLKS